MLLVEERERRISTRKIQKRRVAMFAAKCVLKVLHSKHVFSCCIFPKAARLCISLMRKSATCDRITTVRDRKANCPVFSFSKTHLL